VLDGDPAYNNGVCEDEIQRVLTPLDFVFGASCAQGTDCTDCSQESGGVNARALCTSCPTECIERGLRLGQHEYCLEALYTDPAGSCHAECNNWECGHISCDFNDVVTKCTLEHAMQPEYYQARPANSSLPAGSTNGVVKFMGTNESQALVPVEIKLLKFETDSLMLSEDSGELEMQVKLTLQLRWRDSRLRSAPCKEAFSDMLRLQPANTDKERTMKEDYKAHLWFPHAELGDKQLEYPLDPVSNRKRVLSAQFAFVEGAADANCTGACASDMSWERDVASLTMQVSTALAVTRPQFAFYPFDDQVFSIVFRVADADLYECDSILSLLSTLGDKGEGLLPAQSEWLPTRVVAHQGDLNDNGDLSQCTIRLEVQRNSMIFVIKQILTSVLVVYSGLCALFMSAKDHTGDRAALVLVSALILMVNFQTDLGLGRITYLVWWDVFNLGSLAVLIFVLVIIIVEHRLIEHGDALAAVGMNKAVSTTTVVAIYPIVFIWLLMCGSYRSYSHPVPSVFIVVGLLITIVFTYLWYLRHDMKADNRREECVHKLQRCRKSSGTEFYELIEEAFAAFDVDGSGELDLDEARDLLKAMFSESLDPAAFSDIMLEVRRFASASGDISLPSLLDALAAILKKLDIPISLDSPKPAYQKRERSKRTEASISRVHGFAKALVTPRKSWKEDSSPSIPVTIDVSSTS